jgi:hypothetical protein
VKARAASAVDLIERAVELLRGAPPRVHLVHLLGTAPFALALLAFVVDCGAGAGARRGLAPSSALLAALYLAMKAAHGEHARGLRAAALGVDPPPARGERLRSAAAQMRWQPWSLWLLPTAAVAMLPLGWVYAFFHSLAVVGERRRAARLGLLWPRQNHAVLLLLSLVAGVVFVDLLAAAFALPFLVRAFFGVETAATVSPAALFNSTTVGAACVLAYLVLSPLARAVYLLRALDGESRAGGEDLRAEIARARRARAATRIAAAAVVVALGGGVARAAADGVADAPAPAGAGAAARAEALDRALDRELSGDDYRWRERPGYELDADGSWLAAFWDASIRFFVGVADAVGRFWDAVRRWLAGRESDPLAPGGEPAALADGTALRVLVLLAAAALAVGAVVFWRSRRRPAVAAPAVAAPAPAAPTEIADHDAARLESEEWLRLASEAERAGEFRAAARAVHLAGLSWLSRRGWLRLAPTKTNHDYVRELGRRARSRPALVAAYAATVRGLEPVWYGEHAADARLVGELRVRLGEIARHAPAA